MKKSIILIIIITVLCPINMMGQLLLNSTFNKKDTVLSVSLKNSSDKSNLGVYNEYHSGDGGSYLECCFLDSKGNIIDKFKYGYIVNNTPKRFILIKPKQNLEFEFNFPILRNNYNIKNIKKLKVKFWFKYALENDKLNETETIKEFSFE